MTTDAAPPPYVGTTAAHVTRFVAIWVTAMGLLLMVLSGGQLLVWDDPGALLLGAALSGGGGITWMGCRLRLDALQRRNRDFLLSERGIDAMAGRSALQRRVRRWGWWLLAVFVAAGVVVIVAGSALGCQGQLPETCSLPPIDRSVFVWSRAIAVVTGAAYVGLVIVGRSLSHETDHMDEIIAEGQCRRLEGPIPGTSRSRWE